MPNISFTTDGWTSINNDSFIAVTVHFIDPEECVLKTFLLEYLNVMEFHTAVNLSLFLNNCFKDWNITEKVKVSVSDNAANNISNRYESKLAPYSLFSGHIKSNCTIWTR